MSECCPTTPAASATPAVKLPPVEFCAGNYTITFADGRMVKLPRLPAIPDGVYLNPTITVVDGCITSMVQGTNITYSACDPCLVPVVPPVDTPIVIDGDPCNLSSVGPDGLLTQLVVTPTSCIGVSGCGTGGSPLALNPIISPDANNALECRANGLYVADVSGGCVGGVNFIGCAMTISNGCITALPLPFQPVLNLYNDDGSMIIDRDVGNPCSVRIRSTSGSPAPTFSVQTSLFANVAGLPASGTPNGFAVVGTAPGSANLYTFVSTIGWLQVNGATVTLP